MGKKEFWGDLH